MSLTPGPSSGSSSPSESESSRSLLMASSSTLAVELCVGCGRDGCDEWGAYCWGGGDDESELESEGPSTCGIRAADCGGGCDGFVGWTAGGGCVASAGAATGTGGRLGPAGKVNNEFGGGGRSAGI
jgi:hypothetical protein